MLDVFPDLVQRGQPEPHFRHLPHSGVGPRTPLLQHFHVADAGGRPHVDVGDVRMRTFPAASTHHAGLYRSHVCRLVKTGRLQFVKSHSSPEAGTHSLVWGEAVKISGADPDFRRRDLWEAIEAGAYPGYELGMQIFSEEQAEGFSFDVLEPRDRSGGAGPVIPVGLLMLNRDPDNFFSKTEQIAFSSRTSCPASTSRTTRCSPAAFTPTSTPGSPPGRPTFHEIPINAPIAQVHNNQRNGMHPRPSTAATCPRAELPRRQISISGRQAGFISFPEPHEATDHKIRDRTKRFANHYAPRNTLLEQPDQHRENPCRRRLPLRAAPRSRRRRFASRWFQSP